jgi:hypothetical protein
MPTLTKSDLATFKSELDAQFKYGEITVDEYASLTEDIAVIERRNSR